MRFRLFAAAVVTATFGLLGATGTSASTWAPTAQVSGDEIAVTGTLGATISIGKCMANVPPRPALLKGTGSLDGLGITSAQFRVTATCGEFGLLDEVTGVSGTYITSDGDKLRSVGYGSPIKFDFDAGTGTFTMTNELRGGTGTFVGASGSETVTVEHNFFTGDVVLRVHANVTLSERAPAT